MFLVVLSALAALQAVSPDPAAPGSSPIQAVATGMAPAAQDLKPGERKVKMVCRTETPTGSRFGKRVCMTVQDFQRRQEESRKGLAEMQQNVNTTYGRGN